MRKALKILFIIAIISILCTTFSSAVLSAAYEDGTTAPCYLIITYSNKSFSKSNSTLICSAINTVKDGYTAEVVVRLQIDDDRWRTVRTWTVNNGTLSAKIDESYTPTVSGDYRMWVEYKAYDSSGKLVESANDYSEVIHV